MMITAPGCLYVSTHPAEPHVVAALLQLQGLQQLLNCLEATEKQSVEKSTVGRYINLLYDNFWCRDRLNICQLISDVEYFGFKATEGGEKTNVNEPFRNGGS